MEKEDDINFLNTGERIVIRGNINIRIEERELTDESEKWVSPFRHLENHLTSLSTEPNDTPDLLDFFISRKIAVKFPENERIVDVDSDQSDFWHWVKNLLEER